MWTPGDRPVDWCCHGRPSSLWCGSRRLTCCNTSPSPQSPPPPAAACRTPLLFWSSREPHGIFTKTLGLHSCSHQTAVAACCRYCSCCFYTLANKVAIVAEFPIFYVNQCTSTRACFFCFFAAFHRNFCYPHYRNFCEKQRKSRRNKIWNWTSYVYVCIYNSSIHL